MAELTPEMIVDMKVPSDPRVSPDGSLVAFVVAPMGQRGEHRESEIWLAGTTGSPSPRKLTAGNAEDSAPRWSPDGSWLYFLSDRTERSKAQIQRLPARTAGEAEELTSWKAGIGGFVPLSDGRTLAFWAEDEPTDEDERRERERDDAEVFGERWPYARLRLLDAASREVRTVGALGDRHVVEAAPNPAGAELAVVSWPTPEPDNLGRGELHVVDPSTGEARLVCELASGGSSLTWGEDGRRIFFIGDAAPARISGTALFVVDVEAGEPEMIAGDLPACPVDLRRGHADTPIVTVARGLDTTVERLGPSSKELTLLAHYPGELRSPDVGDDGRTLAALRSTAQEPSEVWAGAPEGPLGRLTDLNPELRGISWGAQERLSWTADDGLGLDGLLVLPPGKTRDDGPFPLVTLVHGGPYGRWPDSLQLSWVFPGQWLAANGYAVFLPNPRGGMGHGHAFAASVAGSVGEDDYADVISGLDRLVAESVADPERLGIGGWSQGGFMAAWAIGQTDRFKAAVMGAGVSDWGMMVAESDVQHFEAECGGSTGWEGPGPHRHDELSPISYATNISTPVLILHGEKDERVPVSQGRYLARALREFQRPFELVVYPREPHGIRERNHQIDILRRSRAWFDTWLS